MVIDEAADAAPGSEPSGEGGGAEDAGELPPIEPPKSWTKEEKAAFAALPRSLQQTVAEREQARSADADRRLSEVAERQRVLEAHAAAAARARQQYEQALPMLLAQFQSGFQQEFADVRSWDDVEKMQREDPDRYGRWQIARERGEALQAANVQTQARQANEMQARFAAYAENQQKLFFAKAPEFADPQKADASQKAVVRMLNDLGVATDEIRSMAYQGRPISFHDHRFQLMARKAMLYDRAVAASKSRQPNPAPGVQRPGAALPRGAVQAGHIRALESRFDADPSVDNLVNLFRGRQGAEVRNQKSV